MAAAEECKTEAGRWAGRPSNTGNRFIVQYCGRVAMDARNPTLKKMSSELGRIMKGLESNHADREFLLKNTREVVNLCGRAIISVHSGDVDHGVRQLEQARTQLKRYRKRAAGGLRVHLAVAEQELTEAACLICVVRGKSIPSAKALGVTDTAYVLGLLDLIGELKRITLEMLRAGRPDEARRIFEIAVGMYDELSGFAIYGNSVRDIRKKIDSARITIDGMRTVITSDAIGRK